MESWFKLYTEATPLYQLCKNRVGEYIRQHFEQYFAISFVSVLAFQCTILLRVFGFCVKNYYLIGRQAMKRVTTYSGKLYAFSAKLETDAVLKREQKRNN